MFSAASSAALLGLLLALPVLSDPVVVDRSPVTLPISRKFNFSGTRTIVKRDQARARDLHAKATAKLPTNAVTNEPVSNQGVTYIACVGVGSPPTTYNLIVDTGSSNTWIGANMSYVKTNTSTPTKNEVSVSYGSGYFYGDEYIDQVTLAPGLVIHKQSIGVAYDSFGFEPYDGILGIGPLDLTLGTLSPATKDVVPTVIDNLFKHGTIPEDRIAISFEPATEQVITNGEITFGGDDPSKYLSEIKFAPMTKTSPASTFWGINQRIHYGSAATPILSFTAGIVDTGTTLILIATDAFDRYQKATGAVNDFNTGLLRITSAQYTNLTSLFFTVHDNTFELTPNAQIWPRSLNTAIGGNADSIYLVVNDIGSGSGSGLDFINGYTFLERFYSVFDTTYGRVGLANTNFTTATSN